MAKPVSIETLLACVRIRSDNIGGSGTVIYSRPNGDSGHSTYLLTNNHVIENNVKIEKRWNTVLKRETKAEIKGTVEAHFFNFRWEQRAVGASAIQADIMAYDKEEDLALIKLRSDELAKSVVTLYPKGKERELRVGTPVMALGAAMGEPPVLTVGRLSQFGREIENREFWLQTAPTIFGNSGGAVFLEDTEEFIGVPARIAVAMMGFSADAITHLSYMIPITRVYKFLDEQFFRFIYDSHFTEESEAKLRKEKQHEEILRIAAKEDKGGEPEE